MCFRVIISLSKRKRKNTCFTNTSSELRFLPLCRAELCICPKLTLKKTIRVCIHARIQRGAGGPDPPPGISQSYIGFLSNTGPNPLEYHKATKPAFNVGPLSACEQNARRTNDGLLVVVFGSSLPSLIKQKKT